ncbi:MAG TPA: translation initiation factor IF-3 [Conexibacter sp.]|nr:translation initiation factor IF-3 [Conexibacter sp.]
MPVPRRFDRRPPERDNTRINERIRVPEVRLIGEDGQQIGILKTPDALRLAQERDLDLVEVAADARPPVCRILDYSKYRYEQAQKVKAAKKHQQQITIREIKFRPKIALNDYETKKGHVTRFLKHKDKVKITIMFRGREVTHPERGQVLLERLAEELADLAIVEQRPIQDGRNMTMMLGPSKAILAEAESGGARKPRGDAPRADAAPAEATPAEARADAAPAEAPARADAAPAEAEAAPTEAPAEAEAAPAEAPAEAGAAPEAPAEPEAAPAAEAEADAPTEEAEAPARADAPAKAEAPARAAAPARRAAARADAPARRAPARRAAARARRRAAARGDETPAEGAAATS